MDQNVIEAINKINSDFIEKKKELKQNYLAVKNDKEKIKFEKELAKEEYRNYINVLKTERRQEVFQIKNPQKYKLVKQQMVTEKSIMDLQKNYIDEINKKQRAIKKLKRVSKAERDNEQIQTLKQQLKDFKINSKVELKNNIEKIEEAQSTNKFRRFKNTSKVYGANIHRKVMAVLGKIANQRHLMAIRNAFSSLMPLIMIASFITILRNIPTSLDPASTHAYLYTYFNATFDVGLVTISNLTLGLMAIALSVAIGINLGQNYGEAPLMSGIMGFLGFILWVGPEDLANSDAGQGLPITLLGSQGLFAALIFSIVMFELYRIFKKYRITIRLPKAVPQAVGNSFIAIIPAVLYALVVLLIRYVANFDLLNEITNILSPIGSLINDNFGAVLLIVIFNSLFWWLGIHGSAVTGIITYPFWYPAIAENTTWFNDPSHFGDAPNTFVEPFYQWTIWIGGGGSVIGLAIVSMIASKSRLNKAMSKATFVPTLFNISEPMMFGLPIVLNIWLFIPFMLAPICCSIISVIFVDMFHINWVVSAPWSLPAPIGSFLASGNDWKAIVTSCICIAVATGIYWPFFVIYDRQQLEIERKQVKEKAEAAGMNVIEYMKKEAAEAHAVKK